MERSEAGYLKLTPEQEEWLAEQMRKANVAFNIPNRTKGINPCIAFFGAGPTGQSCKACKHLSRVHKGYIKCDLRHHTNGPGSDHRVNWPACAKFEKGLQSTEPPSESSL